ncbi:NmrA family NAD(P)-binding protein [Streptomyces sp. NPDC057638]|uniref:NmrA family NAD(P)-binding protein n=1 Tax=Streptomyces sp. NPDC057638 TaxID=3346190 RepID=UPI0036800683
MAPAHVIAVTGVSGRLGGRVARRLAERGAEPRLLGREPARLPSISGATVGSPAPYGDGEAMERACAGARTLFLVSAKESRERVREQMTAVDAAVAAGVERIVYVSFLGAGPEATFTFARDHWHTEEYIRATGVAHTFLRNSFYCAALAAMPGPDAVIRGPAGDGRVSAVAHDDIADAAVGVLLGEGHDGVTYDLTGPAALTLAEAAEELSRFAGREVTYVAETREEAYTSRAHYGAREWEVTGWVTSYEAIAAGEMAMVSDAVPKLAERPATPFSAFLRENPAVYRHLRPS